MYPSQSIAAVATVGYGDVPTQTSAERVVACVCMLNGTMTFAHVIGSIVNIINSMDKESAE